MQKLQLTIMAAVSVMAVQVYAIPYNITFDGGGSSAVGQIDVVGGLAISGYLNVTTGPAQGTYSLYTWSGGGVSSVRVGGGTDLIVDNVVNVGAIPFFDVYGLAFVNQPEGIDFSLNYGNVYNLAGFGPVGYAVPNATGTATLTAVPDGGMTVALLGSALMSLGGLRRKLFC